MQNMDTFELIDIGKKGLVDLIVLQSYVKKMMVPKTAEITFVGDERV